MTRDQAEEKLQKTFGFEKFYDDQWDTIERVLKGERILLIEKTGYGKSLCYQFPAVQFDGLTVVFSPLLALMRDQLKKLNEFGIPAKCINSEQEDAENEAVIKEAKDGRLKLLYIAPERQENDEWIDATRSMNLKMVVIDEAHCISVWGHDFRPAFRRIINLVKLLPAGFPVLATTATATQRVEQDIVRQMGGNTVSIRGNLVRLNFHLRVVKVNSEEEKMIWLGKNLDKLPGTGVIYTGTRINTEVYSQWLEFLKLSSVHYNAGLDAASRKQIEDGLLANQWKCVVATNALGMGIDKPDIRFIIHTQMPASPIHYYQEIGRAGRDGKPTLLLLFYHENDKSLPQAFIDGGRPSPDKYQKVIDTLKKAPMGEFEIARATNLTRTQVRTIKADLMEQGIINEVRSKKTKKYEYRYGAPALNTSAFQELRNAKIADLAKMIEYIDSSHCRMNFLCNYLGDSGTANCGQCDNDLARHVHVTVEKEWEERIECFRSQYFPILEVSNARTILADGVAGSYYGVSAVGAAIHRCKYEHGGDFPDFLVKLTLKAFRQHFGRTNFDLVVYVPPTESGNLVKNFASKIASTLGIPISHNLRKVCATKPQKIFQNGLLKADNVAGVFEFKPDIEAAGKSILLIDDICDSGATIKEIGKLFTTLEAKTIAPLVIAKTIGGDLST
ncbi:MAG: RecQ family ATP-dependent DNA helicase [Bacteroidota bacterium]|jgi:ATP-dependent DNA helicase RecQ